MSHPRPAGASRALPLVLCVALLGLAATLRCVWFDVPERSPDEQLYTTFGAHIAAEGPGWLARLDRDFNRDLDVEYPWPNRVGYTCLIGLAMRLTGHRTVRTAEAVSTLASVLLVALTGLLGARFLGAWPAAIAMLFLAVSPLDLALARRAWQDDVTALVTLAMTAAFLFAATEPARRARAAAAAFFALSAWALLVKESTAIPFGLGTLGLAAIARARTGRLRPALGVLLAGAAAAAVAALVVTAVCGGWNGLLQTLARAREVNAPDDYMRRYQSGGIGYYLTGLGMLNAVPWLLGGAGALLAIARAPLLAGPAVPPRARAATLALAGYALGFCAVAFGYFSKNMRFLSPVFAPVYLLAGALVVAVLGRLRARVSRRAFAAAVAATALALAASAALDLRRFDHYFNEMQIQDLATPWFQQADADDR